MNSDLALVTGGVLVQAVDQCQVKQQVQHLPGY